MATGIFERFPRRPDGYYEPPSKQSFTPAPGGRCRRRSPAARASHLGQFEAALSRQVDFEAQASKLDAVQQQAREEEQRLETGLAALSTRKRQMEDALQAYLLSQREAALGGDGPTRPARSAEKKLDAAEQAFDRAMSGAGGTGFTRTDGDTINRVAEIDGMQRSATVAERLAALKAKQAA